MTDPETEYRRLVSGDPGALRAAADTLTAVARRLADAGDDVSDTSRVPEWSGTAATSFAVRIGGLARGAAVNGAVVERAGGALETAAEAYDTMADDADACISSWRNRPGSMHPALEELLARLVTAALLRIGTAYNKQLAGIAGVLKGEDVDLDELDGETREWVEKGLQESDDWSRQPGNNSSRGPLIPNTAATGDDRGLVPQGLGYDAETRSLLQAYYGKGKPSTLAVIDELTGRETREVQLGDYDGGRRGSEPGPTHAGGVAVDGDKVYVTDNGKVFTYSLADIRGRKDGEPAPQAEAPQADLKGGSYATVHEGKLYLGDHDANKMYVYERGEGGRWDLQDTVDTPKLSQGVTVRDDEYVFSTSYGRHEGSDLVVQDRLSGQEVDRYSLPNMSQGVVEVDGQLVTSYESGAGKFSEASGGALWGLLPDDLWASPYMTRTPLTDLDLAGAFDVEPASLTRAAGMLDGPASVVSAAASTVDGVQVPASALGQVPAAATLARAVSTGLDGSAASLRTGHQALQGAASALETNARAYEAADAGSRTRLSERSP